MRLPFLLLPLLAACASAPPPAGDVTPDRDSASGGRTEAVTIDEGDSMIIGIPADLPADYVPSLRAALEREPAVRSARLFQVYTPSDDVISVTLAVEFDGPDSEIPALVNRIGPVAAPPVERMGRAFGFVRAEQAQGMIPENAIEVYVRD